MKKFLLVLLIVPLILLSGCSSKEKKQMLALCDKVDSIVQNYRDKSINEDEFISQILDLKGECKTDDYLCQEITAFEFLDSNSKKEIFDAHAGMLTRDCQLIREKFEK